MLGKEKNMLDMGRRYIANIIGDKDEAYGTPYLRRVLDSASEILNEK